MKKAHVFFAIATCAFAVFLLTVFLLRNTPNSPFYAGIYLKEITKETPRENPQITDGKININTAELTTLVQLPGIGETLAQNIVNYREKHGPFESIEELKNVEGIGPAKFRQIQNLITVGGSK